MTSAERQALPMTLPFARLLLANGDPEGAALLLKHHLSSLDPDDAPCDLLLLEAAALYSDITGDPGWTRYAVRARLHFPAPRHSAPSPRPAQPDPAGHPTEPGLHRPYATLVPLPGLPMRLLHDAQSLYWQGHCGEAIRTATKALNLWRNQQHDDGGTTLLLWLAAMLCACRRDNDAEAQLFADSRLLPPPGSPERHEFAEYGIRTFARVSATHDQACARWQHPALLADLGALTLADAAAQPWPERRNRWWRLLLSLPDTS
ncbi:hypothetical protein [Actinoplanes sp. NBRC 103695]|uniref:hypothetical protein n=1 Tax=Actinoplanes sp. NBRC 103695 TaxID=3032202 RepID=UPI00249FAC77|nr:hypothetical protein [Actinoplanes sp. NBRC 103695]GLZ00773.1 hypothetical protein Acsp02_80250 [Actinoplanes sp. NBRC 103695]